MAVFTITESVARNGGTVLLPWVEFALEPYGGGSRKTFRWSDVPITYPGKFIEPRVVEWSRYVRALSDDYGNFENQQFGFTVADISRDILNLFDDPNYKYFWDRYVAFYLQSVASAAAGDSPFTIAAGVVRNVEPAGDRKLTFTVEDALSTEFSTTYLDEELPRRLVSKIWFTTCPAGETNVDGSQKPNIVGLPEPIIYGRVSDYDLGASDRKGPVPGLPVGTETVSGNPNWHRILIAAHAVKSIEDLYLGGTVVDSGRYGVDVLAPGKSGWPFGTTYRDIVGLNGVTRRYTLVYLLGPAADAALYGTAPLTADVQGIESVGDGSGTLLTNIYDQYNHFMKQWALQDYLTGNWLSTPYYDDDNTQPYVNDASFATAKGFRPTYDGAGVIGANGDRRTKKEWLKSFNNSADARCGFDRNGQFLVTCGEPQNPVASYDDVDDIIAGSVDAPTMIDELRNVIPFSFRRDWARGIWGTDNRQCSSPNSIAQYRMRREDQLREFWFTRPQTIADDIAKHFLHRKMNPPRKYTFETGLHGLIGELGDTIAITDRDAYKNGGLTNQSCMVERMELDPALGVVRIQTWDYSTMPSLLDVDATYTAGSAQVSSGYSYGSGGTVSGSGGDIIINNITGGTLDRPLGGSDQTSPDLGTGWVDVPLAFPIELDSSRYVGRTIKVNAWLKTDGTATQVRLWNKTTSAQVGASSTTTSSSFTKLTFTVTLTSGNNEYVLQVLRNVTDYVWAYGVIVSD